MDTPRIQYAQTKDGVSIAFWTMGKGTPLVSLPSVPFSHIQLEWDDPEVQAWYQRLAQNRMLVRYDGRGTGLSQRDATDFSLGAQLLDLQAIVDRLGHQNYALFGAFYAGPVAIAHAVENPERVSRLLLWHSFARATDYLQSAQTRGLLALPQEDWELFTETLAHVRLSWSSGKRARRWADLIRNSITPEAFRAAMDALPQYDVEDILPLVKLPTLIVQRRDFLPSSGIIASAVDIPGILASGIPDARLALVEGESGAPHPSEKDTVNQAIDDFLSEDTALTAGKLVIPTGSPLSRRELEVLRLLAGGKSNKEIAGELVLSVHTVQRHVANIYGKIGAHGRADATAFALKHGVA